MLKIRDARATEIRKGMYAVPLPSLDEQQIQARKVARSILRRTPSPELRKALEMFLGENGKR